MRHQYFSIKTRRGTIRQFFTGEGQQAFDAMCQRLGLLEFFRLLSDSDSTFFNQAQAVIHVHPRQSNDAKVACHALKLPQCLLMQ